MKHRQDTRRAIVSIEYRNTTKGPAGSVSFVQRCMRENGMECQYRVKNTLKCQSWNAGRRWSNFQTLSEMHAEHAHLLPSATHRISSECPPSSKHIRVSTHHLSANRHPFNNEPQRRHNSAKWIAC